MKKKIKDLSIFVGPHEVAGFYQKLCEGFKQHRINYTYVLFEEHPFGYKGETSKPLFLKLARRISKFKNNKKNHFLKFPINLLVELLRSIWAIKTIFTHDVFIFGFGHSLMRFNLDLPLIKILGKKTISNW